MSSLSTYYFGVSKIKKRNSDQIFQNGDDVGYQVLELLLQLNNGGIQDGCQLLYILMRIHRFLPPSLLSRAGGENGCCGAVICLVVRLEKCDRCRENFIAVDSVRRWWHTAFFDCRDSGWLAAQSATRPGAPSWSGGKAKLIAFLSRHTGSSLTGCFNGDELSGSESNSHPLQSCTYRLKASPLGCMGWSALKKVRMKTCDCRRKKLINELMGRRSSWLAVAVLEELALPSQCAAWYTSKHTSWLSMLLFTFLFFCFVRFACILFGGAKGAKLQLIIFKLHFLNFFEYIIASLKLINAFNICRFCDTQRNLGRKRLSRMYCTKTGKPFMIAGHLWETQRGIAMAPEVKKIGCISMCLPPVSDTGRRPVTPRTPGNHCALLHNYHHNIRELAVCSGGLITCKNLWTTRLKPATPQYMQGAQPHHVHAADEIEFLSH
ncbi:hypothetical protein VP01_2332g1 [Puccinia sorghi]|uniref:Uncharacterized protein n=1 Tax=Puccinia sorghi TaxID=27349 RepID=A0A0L6V7M7_9BASI|nr:hypothetical protein VP01_2332g1 [Puccinia sorghi]